MSVAEVNATCQAANKKAAFAIVKTFETLNKITVERKGIQVEVTELVPALVKDAEKQVNAIRTLEVSDSDKAQVQAITDAYRTWIEKAKGTPLKVIVANDIYDESRELAGKYGLVKCGLSPFEERYLEEAQS